MNRIQGGKMKKTTQILCLMLTMMFIVSGIGMAAQAKKNAKSKAQKSHVIGVKKSKKVEPVKKKSLSSLVGDCCIAGTYDGGHVDTPSLTCPDAEKGKFVFDIHQSKGCGSKLWGKVVGDDGGVLSFSGKIVSCGGPAGPCVISGVFSKPGETIKIRATLNKKGGKWSARDGVYSQSTGCRGKFKMSQR